MTKMIVFLMLFLPSVFGFSAATDMAVCDCPVISNVQKTGQTSTSISYTWSSSDSSAQYEVWYYRDEDHYTSGVTTVTSLSHNFTSLAAGHYTFYFTAICNGGSSNVIGVEDLVL